MIGEMAYNPSPSEIKLVRPVVFGKVDVSLLVIVHPIATFDAEYITACSRTGPIEVPVVIGANRLPATLLKVADQH